MKKNIWYITLSIANAFTISCTPNTTHSPTQLNQVVVTSAPQSTHNNKILPENTGQNLNQIFDKVSNAIKKNEAIKEYDVLALKTHVDTTGDSLLHKAARVNHITAAEILIQHEFDVNQPNKCGNTPLAYAAYHASPEIVDLLLKAGARYDIKDNSDYTLFDYINIMTRYYSNLAKISTEHALQYEPESKRLSHIRNILLSHKTTQANRNHTTKKITDQ